MLKYISLFLFSAYTVLALIVEPQKLCAKSSTATGPCHICSCSGDGIFICNATECKNENVTAEKECEPEVTYNYKELFCTCNIHGNWRSQNCRQTFRVTEFQKGPKSSIRSNSRAYNNNDLLEIEEGEPCVPGNSYKMACNICRCGEENNLVCTKMACFSNIIGRQFHESIIEKRKLKDKKKSIGTPYNQGQSRVDEDNENEPPSLLNKKDHPELRTGYFNNDTKTGKNNTDSDNCTPGKIYYKKCRECFCTDAKSYVCTRKCSKKLSHHIDVGELSYEEKYKTMLHLPHTGLECEPGKFYRVKCNTCLCSHKRELAMCTKNYCLDTEFYKNAESIRLSGKNCTDSFTTGCTKCECVDKKTTCSPIQSCKPITGKNVMTGHVGHVKLSLTSKDKCVTDMRYNNDCNYCTCIKDGELICTQKLCLTHSQVEILEKKYDDLEANGL